MTKKIVILLFLLVAFTAVPKAASAADYFCEGTVTGAFSDYDGFSFQEFDAYAANGVCQNAVNNWAIALCDGQGDTDVFWIAYTVEEFWNGNWYWVAGGSVAWRCDDGWPVYA